MLETKGWIEYSPYLTTEERQGEHSWLAWMDISSVIDRVDETTELLFGYSKRIIRDEFAIESLAKDKGIPSNASQIVQDEIEEIKSIEKKYGEGEIFGYTTIFYNEIRNMNPLPDVNSDWAKLFELTDKFRELKNLEDSQIRLIVWFEW